MARTLERRDVIKRDFAATIDREFDVLVVGGGIYGVATLHEAACRGLSACLVEAHDFGSGTSWNSLRILHGGLRCLQGLDILRFFGSVAARRRYAQLFPTLVRPLACLMPLYGQGLKRKPVLRAALWSNDLLSVRRNDGLPAALAIPAGNIVTRDETRVLFPSVRADGLEGAAQWFDYRMISSERILMELLRDACRQGAIALNYARVQEVVAEGGAVGGVRVQDAQTGVRYTVKARTVVNCAGWQVAAIAGMLGGESPGLFCPSLAFNVLLDIPPPSDRALAVSGADPDAQILFLVPAGDALVAGTMHVSRPARTVEAVVSASELGAFLDALNDAIPALGATSAAVRQVFAGLLPVTREEGTQLTVREAVLDHGSVGGLTGAYSVAGVKFTTAIATAKSVVDRVTGRSDSAGPISSPLELSAATPVLTDSRSLWTEEPARLRYLLQTVVRDEAVQSLSDLVRHRTNWAATSTSLERVADRVREILGSDSALQWEARDAVRTDHA